MAENANTRHWGGRSGGAEEGERGSVHVEKESILRARKGRTKTRATQGI